jgi:transcriptional regulator with XRE-family HTH domain
MDMRVDADRIRLERTNRAWSQEHLANVTDLGLRTVQRIESGGTASNESISAIASAFEVPVTALLVRQVTTPQANWLTFLAAKRLWVLLPLLLVVQVISPPILSAAQIGLWVWASIEIVLLVAKRRAPQTQ